MGTFQDKVVWITGGGSGIGKACALAFASEGAKVVVSGRRHDRLTDVVTEIRTLGAQGLAVPCDVTIESSVEDAMARVLDELGQVDVVLANAGFAVSGKMDALSDADWRRQFDVNVFGLLNTVRVAQPHVIAQRGRFGLMGSVMGYFSIAKNGPYAASKAAVRSIGETLSLELEGTGATCTAIHPGFVESEIAKVDNQGRYADDRVDKRPAKLMWRADDAARQIVRGLHARKRELVITGHGRAAVLLSRLTPTLLHQLLRRA